MSKKVLLVGHCGPDSSYLRMAIKKARADVSILMADDPETLDQSLSGGVDLVLFNRELGYGFDPSTGVEMIQWLKQSQPALAMMLVSNYPDAQAAAEKAGALPGFGKREIGGAKVTRLLQSAIGGAPAAQEKA